MFKLQIFEPELQCEKCSHRSLVSHCETMTDALNTGSFNYHNFHYIRFLENGNFAAI